VTSDEFAVGGFPAAFVLMPAGRLPFWSPRRFVISSARRALNEQLARHILRQLAR
jgi:hypothetical protein